MANAAQIRAARALLGWSQPKVATAAGVSSMTVKRAEGSGKPAASGDAVAAIQRALESAGVEFTNGNEPGVKLKNADSGGADTRGREHALARAEETVDRHLAEVDAHPAEKAKRKRAITRVSKGLKGQRR